MIDIESSIANNDTFIPLIPDNLLMLAWEPDGEFLVTMSDTDIILLNLRTGQQRPICKCPSECIVMWGDPINE
jgi:hypothetical protein